MIKHGPPQYNGNKELEQLFLACIEKSIEVLGEIDPINWGKDSVKLAEVSANPIFLRREDAHSSQYFQSRARNASTGGLARGVETAADESAASSSTKMCILASSRTIPVTRRLSGPAT